MLANKLSVSAGVVIVGAAIGAVDAVRAQLIRLGPSPSSAINEIVRSPGIQVNLDKISAKPKLGSPQEFAVFMAAQTRKRSRDREGRRYQGGVIVALQALCHDCVVDRSDRPTRRCTGPAPAAFAGFRRPVISLNVQRTERSRRVVVSMPSQGFGFS